VKNKECQWNYFNSKYYQYITYITTGVIDTIVNMIIRRQRKPEG